jgi:Zn-dependent protease
MFNLDPATLIARAVTLLIAFTIHELAHALTADYLGDSTPRRMGRISLNPLVHLDPIGTLVLLVAGFGWAKPVMVNPYNMRGDPRTNMAIVAIAGPISNIFMATLAAIPFRLGLLDIFTAFRAAEGLLPSFEFLLFQFIWINIILAVFNMIPLGPLDGLKVLDGVLPRQLSEHLQPLYQYGMLILLGAIFILPMLGIHVFSAFLMGTSQALVQLLLFYGP